MRKPLAAAGLLLLAPGAFGAMPERPLPAYREGEVLVSYRDGADAAGARALKDRLGLLATLRLSGGRTELLRLPGFATTAGALALLRADPAVTHARPNFRRFPRAHVLPNDTLFTQQWGLHNTGQANFVPGVPVGVVGADMDMIAAWDPDHDGIFDRVGDGSVTIAIIDDSLSTSHPDLAANVVTGRNFVPGQNPANPDPVSASEAHGTLVAGAAGAIGNNNQGVAGTAWNVKLMPLKFDFDVATHIAALEFARTNGAHIVNASFGGPLYDPDEEAAVAALAADGILYVAAAGNDDSNTDVAQLNYPSNFDAPNIVSVAATNRQDEIASFSQYGAITTDVAAPGLQIVTTANGGAYATNPGTSGTSFSAPYTAGIAALIRMVHPGATFGEIKARLIEGAEPAGGVNLRTAGGRVNAASALDIAPRPALVIRSVDWVDANGALDPGETLSVDIALDNLWLDATGVSGTLAADNGVTVSSGAVSFGTIASGGSAVARFDLSVAPGITGHRYVHFTLALTANGGYSATRGFIAEIGRLETDVLVTQTFAPRNVDLYDEFHAWHYDLDELSNGHNQLVITTTSSAPGLNSPDLDLLVKRGEPPRYSITVGINPETDSGFFCTSGTAANCQDPLVFLDADADGHETVVIDNPPAGTYHIVIVNFAQLQGGMTYTLRAFTRVRPAGIAAGGGGGAPAPSTLALLAALGLVRRRRGGA
jgi:subtilisin family serine protease